MILPELHCTNARFGWFHSRSSTISKLNFMFILPTLQTFTINQDSRLYDLQYPRHTRHRLWVHECQFESKTPKDSHLCCISSSATARGRRKRLNVPGNPWPINLNIEVKCHMSHMSHMTHMSRMSHMTHTHGAIRKHMKQRKKKTDPLKELRCAEWPKVP